MAERWVLVTGASTGIGEDACRALAERGFSVFAGVRKEADADAARAHGYTPLILDVVKKDQVAAAAETIRGHLSDAGTLYGLINNAGVAGGGPLEFLPVDDIRWLFEVNVFGLLEVTQAMMPLLRESKGRIVNIGSMAGKVTTPLLTPYSASKHAVEAISDGLRRELYGSGMHVSLVEPGAIKTPIWDKGEDTVKSVLDNLPPRARELYDRRIEAQAKVIRHQAKVGADVREVSKVIVHAMTAATPKTRYLVGKDARMGARAAKWLPDRMFDAGMRRVMGWR